MALNNTSTKRIDKIFVEAPSESDEDLKMAAKTLFKKYDYKNHQQKLEELTEEQLEKVYTFFTDCFIKEKRRKLIVDEQNQGEGIVSLSQFSLISSLLGVDTFLIKNFYASQILKIEKRRSIYKKLTNWVLEQYPKKSYLVSMRVPIEDNLAIESLSNAGFCYVASESLFFKKVTENDFPDDLQKIIKNIRPYQEEDLEKIKKIAQESHKIGKFHCDTHFSQENAEKVYMKTLENSAKTPHHKIFIYESDGEVMGFIVVIKNKIFSQKIEKGYGSLDYICVKNSQKKKGVGVALNLAGMHHLFRQQFSTLYVKTLSHNYPAINLLYKNGFTLASTCLIYHFLKK